MDHRKASPRRTNGGAPSQARSHIIHVGSFYSPVTTFSIHRTTYPRSTFLNGLSIVLASNAEWSSILSTKSDASPFVLARRAMNIDHRTRHVLRIRYVTRPLIKRSFILLPQSLWKFNYFWNGMKILSYRAWRIFIDFYRVDWFLQVFREKGKKEEEFR